MLPTPQGASRSLAAVFTPIKSRGLVDEVCGRIEQAVETGLLTGGQRLPNETELAAALGVSAVTAREALSQLRTSGIIRTVRGRSGGSFIADDVFPSPERALEQLRELTRLQISDLGLHYQAIAAACAGVAARRSDAADMATLRSLIPPEEANPLHWRLALSEFLLEVAAIARSARLARELIRLQTELGALTLLPCADSGYRAGAAGLLAEVAGAVESHQPAAAEASVKALIAATTDWLLNEQSTRSIPPVPSS
ncbi:FadR/GntR family transcriptional regulator [Arthrobacter sp. SO3]|uniref:FadR/GntR family transcriptional regulator n=1 Tax=Arthrobacter sp. SO3 TaxID=1897057 RepID=UPI001CFFB980|nr:GntR family transcriptional regulator [Arthrobacter sp. SO3]MCB5293830.1 putative L-lactate dehydrogenase operon regulatory protein [Arthrobacter sp. SO3]